MELCKDFETNLGDPISWRSGLDQRLKICRRVESKECRDPGQRVPHILGSLRPQTGPQTVRILLNHPHFPKSSVNLEAEQMYSFDLA